jgi:hypothetical protein
MSESADTRDLCKRLQKECACMSYPLVAGRYTPSGWPDRYLHHPIWRGFVEFKTEDGRIKHLQKNTLRELRYRAPGTAYVVRHQVNIITTPDEDREWKYDGSALGLLVALAQAQQQELEDARNKAVRNSR